MKKLWKIVLRAMLGVVAALVFLAMWLFAMWLDAPLSGVWCMTNPEKQELVATLLVAGALLSVAAGVMAFVKSAKLFAAPAAQ